MNQKEQERKLKKRAEDDKRHLEKLQFPRSLSIKKIREGARKVRIAEKMQEMRTTFKRARKLERQTQEIFQQKKREHEFKLKHAAKLRQKQLAKAAAAEEKKRQELRP